MNIYRGIVTIVAIGIVATVYSNGLVAAPGVVGGSPDYGDIVYLLRDENGVPVPNPQTGCRQPLAFPSNEGCNLECVDTTAPCVVPTGDLCEIAVENEACVREVEFGRISVSRSPDDIFTRQLCDVVATLTPGPEPGEVIDIRLDPAGRLIAVSNVEGVEPKTIDSPVQNLAIYWQLMLNGAVNTANLDTTNIDSCEPGSIQFPVRGNWGELITAARGLGAAADKGGKVDVDLIAYLNRILGLTDEGVTGTLLPNDTLCKFYTEEDKGVPVQNEECFLDYRSFGYQRGQNYGDPGNPTLPDPANIPPPPDEAEDGWFEYLWLWAAKDSSENTSGYDLFHIKQGPILNAVFPELDLNGDPVGISPGETGGNIAGFAQAADDTRAVINFMHENPVPVDYVTKVIFEGDDGVSTSTDDSSSTDESSSTASTSSDGGGCSVSGGNPPTDPLLLVIVLAALGYLGMGMTRRI